MNQLHQPYPWYYPDATLMILNLTCDEDALAASLPEQLELRRPARTIAWTLKAEGISGPGRYTELMINTVATLDGKTVPTTPFIYVDNDAAMGSGREVLGVPKKIATIEQGFHNDQLVARASRSGVEFANLGMTLDREGDEADRDRLATWLGHSGLNVGLGGQLIEGGMDVEVTRVVHGRGFIDVRPSAADPLYLLKPVATTATFVRCNITLLEPKPHGA